jgi:hypothetical protein
VAHARTQAKVKQAAQALAEAEQRWSEIMRCGGRCVLLGGRFD